MRKSILGGAALIATSLAFSIISWTPPTKIQSELSNSVTASGPAVSADSLYQRHIMGIYEAANLKEAGLNAEVFTKALTGFYNLKDAGKLSKDRSILSIVDFDQKSTEKRLYIVDLDNQKLLVKTWVAHGNGSGNDVATNFSNISNSYQSSLGFYVTGEIYTGKHGKSLRLDGMDQGTNSNARNRAIVVHGADYVSQGTINALGRLGRCQGCPAVAQELANTVINTINGKTVLFINKTVDSYSSKFLDSHNAALFAMQADMKQLDYAKVDTVAGLDSATSI